jgi:hypothetical protein
MLGACNSPGLPGTLPPEFNQGEARASIPPWAGMPLTWGKLDAIESWLALEQPPSDDYWSVEGQLQLSEGRLLFSNDARGGSISADRLAAARIGFQRVIADTSASEDQIARARDGLLLAESLDTRSTAPVGRSVNSAYTGALIHRDQWAAARARPSRMESNGGSYRYITVHHSAERVPPTLSGSLADSAEAVRSIQRAHMRGENYGDLGYHYVIDPFGRVFEGRELRWQGAHAGGRNNVGNIGICLIGNFDRERPTSQALTALDSLVSQLRSNWKIPASGIRGHSDWKTTDCPGRYLRAWVGTQH